LDGGEFEVRFYLCKVLILIHSFFQSLFPHLNEHEYEAFGMALPNLCKAFQETNTPFDLPPLPSKCQVYAIQASFDWQNKVRSKFRFCICVEILTAN
jgi:hypothetical protein